MPLTTAMIHPDIHDSTPENAKEAVNDLLHEVKNPQKKKKLFRKRLKEDEDKKRQEDKPKKSYIPKSAQTIRLPDKKTENEVKVD